MKASCNIAGCEKPVIARGWCPQHYGRWRQHGDPLVLLHPQPARGEPAAFLDALPSEGDGCVEWPYARSIKGYAYVNYGGARTSAGRVVCARVHGPAPTPGHEAAHSCGNGHGGCVAPWHLSWKTHAENMADQHVHGTVVRGEMQPTAKLKELDVLVIRSDASGRSNAATASAFGISESLVRQIRSGRVWAHLPVARAAARLELDSRQSLRAREAQG
jgi:hypothetical protein